ncbi:hypothetical protein D3C72_1992520 [compost metagenome]
MHGVGRNAFHAAHEPDAFLQVDESHVVVAPRVGLAPHDGGGINGAAPVGRGPCEFVRAAMGADHSGIEHRAVAAGAMLNKKPALVERLAILRLDALRHGFLLIGNSHGAMGFQC